MKPPALILARLAAAGAALLLAAAAARAGTVSVLVLDREGKPLADAVVKLYPANPGQPRSAPRGNVTVVQEKMQFQPPLTLVLPGAKLSFVNQDRFDHHVRGTAAGVAQFTAGNTGGFEFRLAAREEGKPAPPPQDLVLDKPGPVLLGCHIHGSMRGHVYVSDTPWAQRSTAEGQAVWDDVPDGAVRLKVWHPDLLLEHPEQTLQAGAQTARVTVQLPVVPRRRRL
jgi:plastocyanin